MTPKRANQLIAEAGFDTLADLLAPAVAVRPRVLYASEPRPRRTRWLDWLLKPPSDGPSIATVPVLDDLSLPIGTSRFDSVPDVPIGFEWPCDRNGSLLECLAQIDLSELKSDVGASTLPGDGWLLFFVGEGDALLDRFESRVVYVEPQTLTRWVTQVPRNWTRQTCRLDFERIFSLPDAHDWCVRQRMEFVDARDERYVSLQEMLTNGARHYLLGYPRAIAGDVLAEAARLCSNGLQGGPACPIPPGDDQALLLQLDSDRDGPGWMWGDSGSLYFVIGKEDLAARRFERTRLVMQCC